MSDLTLILCEKCSDLRALNQKEAREGRRFCSQSCSGTVNRSRRLSDKRFHGTWYDRTRQDPLLYAGIVAKNAAYRKTERGSRLHRARETKRRAAKLKATPKFADDATIREIYLNCPPGMHVDHIVPLQGREVCGLHVEWNLQYLPGSENCRKSNKLLPALQGGEICQGR